MIRKATSYRTPGRKPPPRHAVRKAVPKTPSRKSRAKIKLCKEVGCHNTQTASGFCRLHYLRNWKRIKTKQRKAAAEKLNKYVERMAQQFPDRYIDEIKKDIRTRAFEHQMDEKGEGDDIFTLFNDPEYSEEIDRMIHDLKIEKEF